jgi:hypothetical protein
VNPDSRLVFSRNLHPSGRRAVHLAEVGSERALCGVLAGDDAGDAAFSCGTCRGMALESGRDTGPERVRIRVGAVEARILSAYHPDLVRILRAPEMGAWWHPHRKWWTVEAGDAEMLAGVLREAGFEVAMTDDGPTWADALLAGMCHGCAKETLAALKWVLVPASPRWTELEAAFAAHLHAAPTPGVCCAGCDADSPPSRYGEPSLSPPAWRPSGG